VAGRDALRGHVGPHLTQNTAWANVERAVARLKDRVNLDAQAIVSLSSTEFTELLRPAGYFNVKAQRLKSFCVAYLKASGAERLGGMETEEFRRWLLAVRGVDHEMADDVPRYAFERPVSVVDAHTRRIFECLG
jgi:endonuclease-3 related protein